MEEKVTDTDELNITISDLKEKLPQALYQKVLKSLEVITDAFDKYSVEGSAISFNGGKDSTVLLHLIHLALTKYQNNNKKKEKPCSQLLTVYFEDMNKFPEETQFIEATKERYGLNLKVIRNSIKEGLQELVDNFNKKAIFSGTRRTDPHSANLKDQSKTDQGWPQIIRVNPILDWDYHDIWTYLRSLNVSYCPLYDKGYTSIGGRNTTVPNPNLKNQDGSYKPAWQLEDASLERAGRISDNNNKNTR